MRVFWLAGLLMASLCIPVPAGAALILYEGFDYDGTALVGKGTATEGWLGAWTNTGNSVKQTLSNDNTSLSGPQTTGDRVLSVGPGAAGAGNIYTVARRFTTVGVGAANEYYFSYLINKTGVLDSGNRNLEVWISRRSMVIPLNVFGPALTAVTIFICRSQEQIIPGRPLSPSWAKPTWWSERS